MVLQPRFSDVVLASSSEYDSDETEGPTARHSFIGGADSLIDAAASLPWTVSGGKGDGMPLHEYVVFGGGRVPSGVDRLAVDARLRALEHRPDAYDAYFRGYRYPMRYLELPDAMRYWRTLLRGTHMLNRCTLDSVEPPRRVDQGATSMALEWDGPPWAILGSPWPPGYRSDGRGGYTYTEADDWPRRYRCERCTRRYFLQPLDRPCPQCGHVPNRVP